MNAVVSSVKTASFTFSSSSASAQRSCGRVAPLDDHAGERLAHLQAAFAAAAAAENNDLQQIAHVLFQLGVDIPLVADREIRHMDGDRRVLIDGADEIAIHALGHERRKRRSQAAHRLQNCDRASQTRLALSLCHALAPETLAAAAHIPVGQIVHKVRHGAGGLGDLVFIQVARPRSWTRVVQAGRGSTCPSASGATLSSGCSFGVELVDVGVEARRTRRCSTACP